ncbi:MAG: Nif3-like dinuclear metal center hexameric protein [Raoultibacter sp.]
MVKENKTEQEAKGLAPRRSGTLSRRITLANIGALESALLKKFPLDTAEKWDRTGITVGDPSQPITGVAVALDPTLAALDATLAAGANVLVTHHPLYLDPPQTFVPATFAARSEGSCVWSAIQKGITVMSFHTALDVSREAQRVLAGLLNLQFKGVVEPLAGSRTLGYGQLCAPKAAEVPLTLAHLAARCTSVFGRAPRVWGDFSTELSRVVTTTGSAGDMAERCVTAQLDCLVCGEIKYHDALAASEAGLCIIDLGHDTSEIPLCAVLVEALESAGVAPDAITLLDQGDNWAYPEASRR